MTDTVDPASPTAPTDPTTLAALAQAGVLAPGSTAFWWAHFSVLDHEQPGPLLAALRRVRDAAAGHGVHLVVGFGEVLWRALDLGAEHEPARLRSLEPIHGARDMVATQEDLLLWLHSGDTGLNVAVQLEAREALAGVATLARETTGYQYLDIRDLTGFRDGTANPALDQAPEVAFVPVGQPGAGGTYVLGQKWRHDLDAFFALAEADQERVIGRTKPTSVQLDPTPPDSHVGRVELRDAAGDELAIYRRSAPWGSYGENGLYFLAFSKDPGRFVTMLERMFGATDGVPDQLTAFSTPVSGAIYWAPPAATLAALLVR